MCPEDIYLAILTTIFESPDPLRSPLYQQGRTSVFIFSKSLQKLVLSENLLISYLNYNVQNVPISRISGHFD